LADAKVVEIGGMTRRQLSESLLTVRLSGSIAGEVVVGLESLRLASEKEWTKPVPSATIDFDAEWCPGASAATAAKRAVAAPAASKSITSRRGNPAPRQHAVELAVCCQPAQMQWCHHFLLVLNRDTHAALPHRDKLYGELDAALHAGMHIILAHEQREDHGGISFKEIIVSTPDWLLKDSSAEDGKRLYKELAVPINGGAHHPTSLHLLLSSIAQLEELAAPSQQALGFLHLLPGVDRGPQGLGSEPTPPDPSRPPRQHTCTLAVPTSRIHTSTACREDKAKQDSEGPWRVTQPTSQCAGSQP
jgi:hypothetical protein